MYSTSDLISIAMASYNGEKYIAEQLDSIINQTHKNIEIIITDDHSSDQTVNIINNYVAKHPFIKLYQNPANLGITKTFENSLLYCKGKYIALSDQDDVWKNNKLEALASSIENEDAIYADSLFVNEFCQSLNTSFKSLINLQSYYSAVPFLLGNCLPGHSMLMKYDFVQTLFPFPKEMMFDRWISFKASSNNGIKYIDQLLVYYRQHQNNAVGTRYSFQQKNKVPISKFERKLNELTAYVNSSFSNSETRRILKKMLQLFNKRLSVRRSIFFFQYFNTLLALKKRSFLKKILYCIKMFFKANY